MTISIVKLDVISRRSGNGLPYSGWVTFSDGKFYGWGRDEQDDIFFSSYRKQDGGGHKFFFNSVKRAKLIEDYLNTHNVETTVIQVKMGL